MRTAAICPTCATYTNSVCVIYDGPYLSNLGISPTSSLDNALQQINSVAGTFEKTANKSTNINADQSSNVKYPSVKAVYDWVTSAFGPALTFTPENVANKSINIVTDQSSNTKYPSVKAVYDWVTANFQSSLGFTPENVANKSTNVSLGTSNTLYPTQNAVKTYVDTAISAIPAPPIPTLQQVLTSGTALSGARNFQGTNAGVGSTGVEIVAFGTAAGFGNTGSYVIGFGLDAVGGNTGSEVTAFGTGAAQGNTLSGVTVFSNLTLPTYADHAAAALAITVLLGATPGCTYLYHNQATNSIGAVRL
jgi:hypothetical protein